MRKLTSILMALILLQAATTAHAIVTFTDNLSQLQVSAFASVGDPINFQLDGPRSVGYDEIGIPSIFGGTLNGFAERTDNDGTSFADIMTSLSANVFMTGPSVHVGMDLSYVTSQQASPGTGDFDSAEATGVALIQLVFDLDQDYNFTFTAPGAAASGTAELEFELRTPGGDAFDMSVINGTQDLFFSGFLAAGTGYRIIINVDDSTNDGVANGGSAMSFATVTGADLVLTPVMSPVPIPAALPLFLSGISLFGFCRRRARGIDRL